MTGSLTFHPKPQKSCYHTKHKEKSFFFIVNKIYQTILLHYSGRYCTSWEKNCFANCQSFKFNFEKDGSKYHVSFIQKWCHGIFWLLMSPQDFILFSAYQQIYQGYASRGYENSTEHWWGKKRLWSVVYRWSLVTCNNIW